MKTDDGISFEVTPFQVHAVHGYKIILKLDKHRYDILNIIASNPDLEAVSVSKF